MTDVDQQVRDAFAKVCAPESVKSTTLAFIESQRKSESSLSNLEQEPVVLKRAHRVVAARRIRFAAPIAACMLLVVLCFGGVTAYCTPAAYVDIDVNPSLELSVNCFGVVVSARGLNEEGCEIVDEVDLTHCSYTTAIDRLAESQALSSYVTEDAMVDVVVSARNSKQADRLERESEAGFSEIPCQTACSRADRQTHESAHACGMSMGRYEIAQQLVEADDSLSMDECAAMSMRELRDLAAAQGLSYSEEQEETAGNSHGAGNGHGEGNGHGHGARREHSE
ncbi:anti-sigma-I factor RsgI family protein [Adlercreutzia sp. ZJ141]|uniref:anti-sigma-I factor RsgI family protein n=1 Tax=Adlercreutzia sp. ZJ141 TaxID=2709406 RepID=UPI0013EB8C9C|nr:hypothetical protein [Adlercreutzia sp. ZJ141]